jgi:hypothetical protein
VPGTIGQCGMMMVMMIMRMTMMMLVMMRTPTRVAMLLLLLLMLPLLLLMMMPFWNASPSSSGGGRACDPAVAACGRGGVPLVARGRARGFGPQGHAARPAVRTGLRRRWPQAQGAWAG